MLRKWGNHRRAMHLRLSSRFLLRSSCGPLIGVEAALSSGRARRPIAPVGGRRFSGFALVIGAADILRETFRRW